MTALTISIRVLGLFPVQQIPVDWNCSGLRFPVLLGHRAGFSIPSTAQLLPLRSSGLGLHSPFFLIDFCTFTCFTRCNSSCSGQRVSPWSGPQGCKSKPFFLPRPLQNFVSRCHPPQGHSPHTLISPHYKTNTWDILLKEKGLINKLNLTVIAQSESCTNGIIYSEVGFATC